jgi:hypothetical protein
VLQVLRFRNPCRIAALALSANDSQLAVAVPPGHLYMLPFGSLEILKIEEDNFEPLAGMDLPYGNLSGVDVCLRKPLVATTSVDRCVRIWNWQEMSLELVKQFQDEAYSIAIHPNGMMVAVGFADKLRLMAVLLDDLKVRGPHWYAAYAAQDVCYGACLCGTCALCDGNYLPPSPAQPGAPAVSDGMR